MMDDKDFCLNWNLFNALLIQRIFTVSLSYDLKIFIMKDVLLHDEKY